MTDVGDRDDEAKALARFLTVDGVVEILCRLAVDRDEIERAQILPAGKVSGARRIGEFGRERLRLRRELERQGVLSQRDLDLYAGIGGFTEHLNDAADRLGVAVRLRGQLGDHDLPGPRTGGVLRSDEDALADAPLGRLDEKKLALAVQPPNDAAICALDDLHDLAFPAAAPVQPRLAHHHAVAVQDLAHLVRVQVQVVAVLRDHEAVAVGMPFDASADEIELGRDEDRALAIAQNLTFTLHRRDAPLERVALPRPDREPARELFVGERDAGFGERLQDELAARDRVLVARRLAFEMRVGAPRNAALLH